MVLSTGEWDRLSKVKWSAFYDELQVKKLAEFSRTQSAQKGAPLPMHPRSHGSHVSVRAPSAPQDNQCEMTFLNLSGA